MNKQDELKIVQQRIDLLTSQLQGLRAWQRELELELGHEKQLENKAIRTPRARADVVPIPEKQSKPPTLRNEIVGICETAGRPILLKEIVDELRRRGRKFHPQSPYSTSNRLVRQKVLDKRPDGTYEIAKSMEEEDAVEEQSEK